MEPFSYTDLSSILQFGEVKMKMERYLDFAAKALESELSGVTMEKKLDFEIEEYVIEHLTDDVEIRFGFNWSHNEIHIAFELSVLHDLEICDQILFQTGWAYHLASKHHIYFKCFKLTEFMVGFYGSEEENSMNEFISTGCKQIVTILNIPTL